jgi:hypothetical protein
MAKDKKERGSKTGQPDQSGGAGRSKADFPIHEHIGRTLKALFDEVAEQPVPQKLRELLKKLEQKKAKD